MSSCGLWMCALRFSERSTYRLHTQEGRRLSLDDAISISAGGGILTDFEGS